MKLDVKIKAGARLLGLVFGLMAAASSVADDLDGLSDPTRPAFAAADATSAAKTAPAGPALQSILISAGQRRAVISGKTYRVGDKYGGATIVDIQPYEVVMNKAGKSTHMRILPKLVKQNFMAKVPADGQKGGTENGQAKQSE